jgi:hypothetical protein
LLYNVGKLLSHRRKTLGVSPGSKEYNASWTPYYSNLVLYMNMDQPLGQVVNGTSMGAQIGPSATTVLDTGGSILTYIQGYKSGAGNYGLNFTTSNQNYNWGGVINQVLDSNYFTFNCWIKMPNQYYPYPILAAQLSGDISVQIQSGGYLSISDDSSFEYQSYGAITDTSWHMVSIVFNYLNATCSFYIDGSLDSTQAVPNTFIINGGNYWLGYDGNSGGFWQGALDELGFWQNDVLTSGDISALYNSGNGQNLNTWTPPNTPGATVNLYYRFDNFSNQWAYPNDIVHADIGDPTTYLICEGPMLSVASKNAGLNQAFCANGFDNQIQISGDSTFPMGHSARSCCFWIKIPAGGSPNITDLNYIFSYGTEDGISGAWEVVQNQNSSMGIFTSGAGSSANIPRTYFVDGNWHHVAITTTGVDDGHTANHSFYVDGSFVTSVYFATNTSSYGSSTVFGTRGFYHYNGPTDGIYLDELGLWNVTLSPTNISTIYNYQK